MVIGLFLTCLALLVLTPVTKLFVSCKNMLGCCKNRKNKEEYTVTHTPDKETTVSSIVFKPDMAVPRYSLPPLPAKNWDKIDCNSIPETAESNSRLSSVSVASMESAYQVLSEPKDIPKDTPKDPLVPFTKAGNLKETLARCKLEAEERAGKVEE